MDIEYDVIEVQNDENAEKALEELKTTEQTSRRCVRCGGKYLFHVTPSGYMIWCENGDFKFTVRGI